MHEGDLSCIFLSGSQEIPVLQYIKKGKKGSSSWKYDWMFLYVDTAHIVQNFEALY